LVLRFEEAGENKRMERAHVYIHGKEPGIFELGKRGVWDG
jgi:hypothetical protein